MANTPTLATRLLVRLTPRGGRDAIETWVQGENGTTYLKVRVAAAPTDGAANEALKRLIAKRLRKPRSAVRILAGEHARLKTIEVEGVSPSEISRAFATD